MLLPHLWPWVAALPGPGSHRGCPWLSSAWAPALALPLASLGGRPPPLLNCAQRALRPGSMAWAPPGAPLGPGHRHQGQTRAVSSGLGPVPVLCLSVPAAQGHGPSSHLPAGPVSSRGHGWTLTGASARPSFRPKLPASRPGSASSRGRGGAQSATRKGRSPVWPRGPLAGAVDIVPGQPGPLGGTGDEKLTIQVSPGRQRRLSLEGHPCRPPLGPDRPLCVGSRGSEAPLHRPRVTCGAGERWLPQSRWGVLSPGSASVWLEPRRGPGVGVAALSWSPQERWSLAGAGPGPWCPCSRGPGREGVSEEE